MSEKVSRCLICAKPSEASICEECKKQIQGEASDKKQKIEKQVQVGSEVIKDRANKGKND